MNKPSADATVVVPTLGRVETAGRLHEQLHKLSPAPKRIIFVFQRHGEWLEFSSSAPCAKRCSICITETSATVARNAGLALAEGTFVAFLDDDCFPVRSNWLDELLKPLDSPEIVLATGPVLDWASASGRLPFVKRAFLLLPPFLEPIGSPGSTVSATAQSIAGGNFAARKRDLQVFGGFDTAFVSPSLYEETELAIRMRRGSGKAVWFTATAPVEHRQSILGGMRERDSEMSADFIEGQRQLLLEKVYGRGWRTDVRFGLYRGFRFASSGLRRFKRMRK